MISAVFDGTARSDRAAYGIDRPAAAPHGGARRCRLAAAVLLAGTGLAAAGLIRVTDAVAQDMTMEKLLEELRRDAPQHPDGPPGDGAAAPAGSDVPPSTSTPIPAPGSTVPPDPMAPPPPAAAPVSTPISPPVAVPVPSPAPVVDPPTRTTDPAPGVLPLEPVPAPPIPAQPAPVARPPVPQPSPARGFAPQQRALPSPPRPKPRNRATRAQVVAQYPWYVQHQIVTPPTPAVRGDITTRLGGPPAPTYPAPSGPQRDPVTPYAVPGNALNRAYPVRGRQPAGYSPVQPAPLPHNIAPAEPNNPASNTLVVGPAGTQIARTVAVRDGIEDDNLGPLLQVVRGGILRHDAAFFGNREEEGVDLNAELHFRPFKFMAPIGAPRPIVGLSINLSGGVNQLYTGFSWQWEDVIFDNVFMGFSLGFALHDGAKTRFDPGDVDRGKEFGLRLLFRESVEIGYHIAPKHSVSLMLDHISNANIADANEGIDSLGIRYGYRF